MNIGFIKDHRPRVAIFVAGIAPMAIWPASGAPLAHPLEASLWATLYAMLFGFAPGRWVRTLAWLQLLALPLTLAWIGTVAVTGAGPSELLRGAAMAATRAEIVQSIRMAFGRPSFLLIATLSGITCFWAVRANRAHVPTGNILGFLFVAAMLILFGAQSNIARLRWMSAGPESKLSVPWMSHVEAGGQMIDAAINLATLGRLRPEDIERKVGSAPRLFQANPGLAVFVLGESLRADALMVEGRGPWSRRLQERLAGGLGVRAADACAPSNATYHSVPRLLTAIDPVDAGRLDTVPTILALAHVAGAKTAWISNQEDWVVIEKGHDFMVKTSAGYASASLDEVAVSALSDFVQINPRGPRAAIMHLHGQHFDYVDRYPADFLGPMPAGLSADAQEEWHYRGAAEYGAKVLLDAAAILDREKEPAFLVFTSDHGENLVSDGTGRKYHAIPGSVKFDVMTPVLFLWNRAFAQSGRSALIAPLIVPKGAPAMIAHRDVAKAWLLLAGMPGDFSKLSPAITWASNEGKYIPCADLPR